MSTKNDFNIAIGMVVDSSGIMRSIEEEIDKINRSQSSSGKKIDQVINLELSNESKQTLLMVHEFIDYLKNNDVLTLNVDVNEIKNAVKEVQKAYEQVAVAEAKAQKTSSEANEEKKKQLKEVSRQLKENMDDEDKYYEKMKKSVQETATTEGISTKKTEIHGSKFDKQKTVTKDGVLTTTEVVKDYAKLNAEIDKLMQRVKGLDKFNSYFDSAESNMSSKLEKLKSDIDNSRKIDNVGRDFSELEKTVATYEKVNEQLKQIYKTYDGAYKVASKLEKLNLVPQEKVNNLKEQFSELGDDRLDKNEWMGFFESGDVLREEKEHVAKLVSEYEELNREQQLYTERQKELNSLNAKAEKEVGGLSKRGVLSEGEIGKISNALKEVNIYSDSFAEDLDRAKVLMADINRQEGVVKQAKEIANSLEKQLDILNEQKGVSGSTKKAIDNRLTALKDETITLEKVNKLHKEALEYIQKANQQIEKQKEMHLFKTKKNNAVSEVKDNIKSGDLNEKNLTKYQKFIDTIKSAENNTQLDKVIAKAKNEYEKMISDQNRAVALDKDKFDWQTKINKVIKEGWLEQKAVKEIQEEIDGLTQKQIKDDQSRVDALEKIRRLYKEIESQISDSKNSYNTDKVVADLNKDKNSFTSTAVTDSESYKELERVIKAIENANTKEDFIKAKEHAVGLTGELKKIEQEEINTIKRTSELGKVRTEYQQKINKLADEGWAEQESIKNVQKEIDELTQKNVASEQERLEVVEKIKNVYKQLETEASKNKDAYAQDKVLKELNRDKNNYLNTTGMSELPQFKELEKTLEAIENADTKSAFIKAKDHANFLNQELKKIQVEVKKLEKKNLLNTDEDTAKVEALKRIEVMDKNRFDYQQKLNNILREGYISLDETQTLQKMINDLTEENIKDETTLAKKLEEIRRKYVEINNLKKIGKDLSEKDKVVSKLTADSNDYKSVGIDTEKLEHAIELLNKTDNVEAFKKAKLEAEKLTEELGEQYRLIEKINSAEEATKRANKIEDLKSNLALKDSQAGLVFSTRPEELRKVRDEIDYINAQIDALNHVSLNEFNNEVKKIERAFKDVQSTINTFQADVIKTERSTIGQLGHAMTRVPVWMSAMELYYLGIQQVQQAIQSILEIDKAMINLQKVTDATTEQLSGFKTVAHDMGVELGKTTAEVINATAEFQKLGYSFKQSQALAEQAILYSNVGDVDLESAQESLISTIAGFGVQVDAEGKNVAKVVDIYNEVSNNFAISSEGIGEALKRSSAVLFEAGNTLEESVAMITSANSVMQNPEKVGNALKTISMRLRGMSEDGEDAKIMMSQMESTFNAVGLSVMKDNKTFKNTYEILNDLSEVWGELADVQRANLVEQIGGKQQAVAVSAMLNNWSVAVNSYESALNSSGSAIQEFKNYQQGIEYQMNATKLAFEGFWTSVIDSDAIKTFLRAMESIAGFAKELVDRFGAIGTAVVVLLPMFSLFNKEMRDLIWGTNGWNASLLSSQKIVAGLGVAMKSLGMALMRSTVIGVALSAVAFALEKIVGWYDKWVNKAEHAVETAEEAMKTFEEFERKANSINLNDYIEIKVKMDNEPLTVRTEEYQKMLDIQNTIASELPQLISYYDEEGNAILKTVDEIREYIKVKQEQYMIDKQTKLDNIVDTKEFEEAEKNVQALKNLLAQQENFRALEFAETIIDEEDMLRGLDGLQQGSIEYVDAIENMFKSIKEKLRDNGFESSDNIMNIIRENIYADESGKYDSVLKGYIEDLSHAMDNLNSEIGKAKNEVIHNSESFVEAVNDAFDLSVLKNDITAGSNRGLLVNALKDAVLDGSHKIEGDIGDFVKSIPDMVSSALNGLDKLEVDVNKLFSSNNPDDYKKALEILSSEIKNNKNLTTQQRNALEMLITTFKKAEKSANGLAESQSSGADFNWIFDVTNQIESFANDIKLLEESIWQLEEGTNLSISQVNRLISMYPQLAKHVQFKNNQVYITLDALKQERKALRDSAQAELDMSKQKAKAKQDEVRSKIANLQANLKAEKLFTKELSKLSIKEMEVEYEKARAKMIASITASHPNASMGVYAEADKQFIPIRKAIEEMKALQAQIDAIGNINIGTSSGNINTGGSSSSSGSSETQKELQDGYYVADQYEMTMNRLNNQIERQQLLTQKSARTSAQYRKGLQDEISLTQQKKNAIDAEIKSLESQIAKKKIQQYGIIQTGGEDNKTARLKSAEIQQEIDEAKKRLEDLKTESAQTLADIQQLQMDIVQSQADAYKEKAESYDDDIAYYEYLSSLYSEDTSQYRQYTQEKINLIKKQKTEFENARKYLEQQLNSNLLTDAQKDEIQKQLEDVKTSIYDYAQAINDAMNSIVQSTITSYQKMQNAYRDEIAYVERMAGVYGEGTKEYANYMRQKQDYIKQQESLIKQEISYIEQQIKANKDLTQAQKDELTEQLADKKNQLYQYQDAIEKLNQTIIDSELTYFNRERNSLKDDIKSVEILADKYDETTQKYRDYMNEKINLMKIQFSLHEQEMAYLKDQLANNKTLTEAQKQNLKDLIQTKTEELLNMQDAIDKANQIIQESEFNEKVNGYETKKDSYDKQIRNERDTIKYEGQDAFGNTNYAIQSDSLKNVIELEKKKKAEMQAQIVELNNMKAKYKDNHELVAKIEKELEKWEEEIYNSETAIKDTQKEIEQLYVDMAENIVDMYKQSIEYEKQAKLKQLDELEKEQKKAHDKEMKRLDKELDKKRKAHNEVMKQIDREKNAKSFEDEVEELQKQREEIEKALDKLMLDDSYEAKAKREELEKELAEIKKELENALYDREIELREEALNDKLEKDEQEIESEKEKLEEQQEAFEESLDKQREELEKYYDDLLNDERKFTEMKEQILNGHFDAMKNSMAQWAGNIASISEFLGENITQNFIDKVGSLMDNLDGLSGLGTVSTSVDVNRNVNTNANQIDNAVATSMTDELKAVNAGISEFVKLNAESKQSETSIFNSIKDAVEKTAIATQELVERMKSSISEKLGMQTMVSVKGFQPNASLIEKELSAKIGETNESNEYNININIDNMNGTKSDIDKLSNQIMNTIKRSKGGRF